jgi:hypothetical protein
MKTLKYILILTLGLFTFNSCLVDDTTKYDANADGPNLAGFELNRTSVAGIADGSEYIFPMKVKIIGPTMTDLTGDITLTVAPDPASTAIEGTHFRIDNPVIVLSKNNNYLGLLNVTMTTEGIATPIENSPVLILNATSATGDPTVINNGKPLEITLNFACFSEFQGSYTLTINRVSTTGVASTIVRTDEVITKIGTETYRTKYVGHWTPAQLAPGTPGFTFTNNCNKLSIAEQYLADYWANIVTGTAIGTADPVTGDIYMEYSVCYPPGTCNTYKCTYVKN